MTQHTPHPTGERPSEAFLTPLRTALVLVLAVAAAGNAVASAAAVPAAQIVLGTITALAALGLLVSWTRSRA